MDHDVSRVAVTGEAAALLRTLTAQHGPLMFHQSGGCCDGSSPMCYPVGMFRTGPGDVLLGTIDVVPGRGAGFSVEGPTGMRFLIRSRLLTEDEARALDLLG